MPRSATSPQHETLGKSLASCLDLGPGGAKKEVFTGISEKVTDKAYDQRPMVRELGSRCGQNTAQSVTTDQSKRKLAVKDNSNIRKFEVGCWWAALCRYELMSLWVEW